MTHGASLHLVVTYFHTWEMGATGSPHRDTERIKTEELRKIRPLIEQQLTKGLEDPNLLQAVLSDTLAFRNAVEGPNFKILSAFN